MNFQQIKQEVNASFENIKVNYKLVVHEDLERAKEVFNNIDGFGHSGNFELLKELGLGKKLDGYRVDFVFFELNDKDGNLVAFLPMQRNSKKGEFHFDLMGGQMGEVREIFATSEFNQEVMRHFVYNELKGIDVRTSGLTTSLGLSSRLNYFAANLSNVDTIDDFLSLTVRKKSRSKIRTKYSQLKKLKESGTLEVSIDRVDLENFNLEEFIAWCKNSAVERYGEEVNYYEEMYERNGFKVFGKFFETFKIDIRHKGNLILSGIFSIDRKNKILHCITSQMFIPYERETEDYRETSQARKFYAFSILEFAKKNEIDLVLFGAGNFGRKSDVSNLTTLVYFYNTIKKGTENTEK